MDDWDSIDPFTDRLSRGMGIAFSATTGRVSDRKWSLMLRMGDVGSAGDFLEYDGIIAHGDDK
jgi:hypothetical protein